MNIYTATEQAYKIGYNAGVEEFAEKIKLRFNTKTMFNRDAIFDGVNKIVREMTERKAVRSDGLY